MKRIFLLVVMSVLCFVLSGVCISGFCMDYDLIEAILLGIGSFGLGVCYLYTAIVEIIDICLDYERGKNNE